ncbi:MAG: M23 family metallopeptidase [Bacteroidales bacterium]
MMLKEIVNTRGLKGVAMLVVMVATVQNLIAQSRPDYAPPLNIPMVMSGSFCESRSEHFHTGIDIKTQGVVGHTLHSIADARLYRMKIRAGGYGNALYLRNADSTITLYGHMHRFRDDIQEFARHLQYQNESWFLDTIFEQSVYTFKKGEIIGYAGNSGRSGGPHLHFEIRLPPDQNVIDPQQFWYFKDDIPPEFRKLAFYDLDADHKTEAERSFLRPAGEVKDRSIRLEAGNWGIGTEIMDRMNGTYNRYGIIELVMRLDGDTVYHSHIKEFPWKYQKYTEAWFDAYYLETEKIHVQRCFREKGNHAMMFEQLRDDGIIKLAAGERKNVEITARDGAGNWSSFAFTILGVENTRSGLQEGKLLSTGKSATLPFEGAFVYLPAGALYRDTHIDVSCRRNAAGEIEGWDFRDHYYAFMEAFSFSVDGSAVPSEYRNRTVLIRERNDDESCLLGYWQGPYYTVKTDEAGFFSLDVDTVSPKLSGSRMRDSASFVGHTSIQYRVSEELSGLDTYNAWIDGKWVLLEHKSKSDKLIYKFDNHVTKGRWHNWKIQVSDAAGNISEDSAVFYY